jgi:hypothetical protein
LGDRNREGLAGNRLHLESVRRDQLAVERPDIEMEIAHGRTIDDPKQELPALLDLDRLGIS